MNAISSKMKGTITELECASYLMKLGYALSVPLGDTCPYDLVVDIDHKLYKIQCKHGKSTDDSVSIECTTNINTRTRLETHQYKPEDVDFFATFDNGICYLIPFEEAKLTFMLRKKNPKNNQNEFVHWAEDYEASYIIETKIRGLKLSKPSSKRIAECKSIQNKHKYRWATDGKLNIRLKIDDDVPDGFWIGRSGRCNQYYTSD